MRWFKRKYKEINLTDPKQMKRTMQSCAWIEKDILELIKNNEMKEKTPVP